MVKICLVMIVKDESKIIGRCINKTIGLVDAISVMDTGSTDSTVDIVKTYSTILPTSVQVDPFVNFGVNRERSFVEAKKFCINLGWDLTTSYALLIDADMCLEAGDFNKESLTCGGYNIAQINQLLHYYNLRLARLDFDWKCVGVTHEYWTANDSQCVQQNLDSLTIDDVNDGGCKGDKTGRDIRLLEKGLLEEPQNVARYTFYLARSYMDISGSYENNDRKVFLDKAIVKYKERIQLGSFYEEVWYSYYMLGECYERLDDLGQAFTWFWLAYHNHKVRREPLLKMATILRHKARNFEAYTVAQLASTIPYPVNGGLFVESRAYESAVDLEISICGYYVPGARHEAKMASERILLNPKSHSYDYHMARNNFVFHVDKLDAEHHLTVACDRYDGFTVTSASTVQGYVLFQLNNRDVGDVMNMLATVTNGDLGKFRELTRRQYTAIQLFWWDDALWGMTTCRGETLVFPIDTSVPGDVIPIIDVHKIEGVKKCTVFELNVGPLRIVTDDLSVMVCAHPPPGSASMTCNAVNYITSGVREFTMACQMTTCDAVTWGMITETLRDGKGVHRFVKIVDQSASVSHAFFVETLEAQTMLGVYAEAGKITVVYLTSNGLIKTVTIDSEKVAGMMVIP